MGLVSSGRHQSSAQAGKIAPIRGSDDNGPMPASPWQRRIQRAQQLAGQHPFAAEILGFYIPVARFQEDLHRKLSVELQSPVASADRELTTVELAELTSRFQSFLSVAEAHGTKALAELSRELCTRGRDGWSDLLQSSWIAHSSADAEGLLAQAFLQPYAELRRSRAALRPSQTTYALCPFCSRKPALGVLRQMGDGGARSMICSFCQAEWDFRRIVCPGCGEEDDKKLAVFTATDFDYIRVEGCDSCKTYIKTIDLTKNGRAEPLVDELASAPLDLWAREHSYAKLQTNLFGM
jgi:formate dehydrogenase accessory protein FdhE